MITINKVLHRYQDQTAVRVDQLHIREAEEWLLLGNSGTGKSTLLHILCGILKPTQGEVLINDTNIYQLSGSKRDTFRARYIGIIFQKPHLVGSLTVEGNLLLTQYLASYPSDSSRIEKLLDSLGIGDKKHAYPSELSQGQAQRVSIARAVLNRPPVIIADEPTSSLDDLNTTVVVDLLKEQASAYGATVVVATHDQRVKNAFHHTYLL